MTDTTKTTGPLFILWDPKDGDVPRSADGGYLTSGTLGLLTLGNAYLSAYADFTGDRRAEDLDVHERCPVRFRLSGECGDYTLIRVQ